MSQEHKDDIIRPHYHMCLFCSVQYACERQHTPSSTIFLNVSNVEGWSKETIRVGSRCCAACRLNNLATSLRLQAVA